MLPDQNIHLRPRPVFVLGVTLILPALEVNHLPKSGDATSSSKAFSVDSFVNASHSAAEYFFLSGVLCIMDGYNASFCVLSGVLM